MKPWIKFIAKYLLVFLVAFAIFNYGAQFSTRASLVLAAVVLWVFDITRTSILGSKGARFVPHHITIRTFWHLIFADLGIPCADAEWKRIWSTVNAKPAHEYDLLRNWITFTLLERSPDGEKTIVWSDNHHSFASDADIEEEFPAIVFVYKTKTVSVEPERGHSEWGVDRVLRFRVIVNGEWKAMI
jgi:hypothetical protein